MNKLAIALSLGMSLFIGGVARADDAPATGTCESRAVGKDGKPLAGAAKASFLKKCQKDEVAGNAAKECEPKAVSKDGKPLAGAAKNAFMKKCVREAGKAK